MFSYHYIYDDISTIPLSNLFTIFLLIVASFYVLVFLSFGYDFFLGSSGQMNLTFFITYEIINDDINSS